MVSTLRDELERSKISFEKAKQEDLLKKESEMLQLQSTIIELRTKLGK
jgi:hypothetical protein